MNKFHRRSHLSGNKGFTLLEIIIVLIIISILASIALPKYFKTVEFARGFEALVALGNLRFSMYRYYAPQLTYIGALLSNLDVENPNDDPRRGFDYALNPPPTVNTFIIKATRITDPNSWISMDQDGAKTGNGTYTGIR